MQLWCLLTSKDSPGRANYNPSYTLQAAKTALALQTDRKQDGSAVEYVLGTRARQLAADPSSATAALALYADSGLGESSVEYVLNTRARQLLTRVVTPLPKMGMRGLLNGYPLVRAMAPMKNHSLSAHTVSKLESFR